MISITALTNLLNKFPKAKVQIHAVLSEKSDFFLLIIHHETMMV